MNFPFSACCEGVCEEGEVPVGDIVKAAQVLMKKILELTAKDLDLPVNDKRVHRETRSRLLRRTVEMADLQLIAN